ncbi:hypothetical protein ABK040_013516 [Willaertia magna]
MEKNNHTAPSTSSSSFGHNNVISIDVNKKRNSASVSAVSTQERADICDATTCLEIAENNANENNDLSCKACAAKQANTVFSVIEAIPLSIKLFLMVIFAICALIAFSCVFIQYASGLLDTSQNINHVVSVSLLFSNILHELQNERNLAFTYYYVEEEFFKTQLLLQMNKTDEHINNYLMKNVVWNGNVFESGIESTEGYTYKMEYFIGALPKYRENVMKRNFNSSNDIINFYSEWNENIIGAVLILTYQSNDPTFKEIHQSYSHVTLMKEQFGIESCLFSSALGKSIISKENYDNAISTLAKYNIIYNLFDTVARSDIRKEFDSRILNTQFIKDIRYMENTIIENPTNIVSREFTVVEYFNNCSIIFDKMRSMEQYIRGEKLIVAKTLQDKAISYVVGFSVATVLVVIISIILACFFSRTIVIPWKRLLRTQKERTKELSNSYSHLSHLLERISAEEQKTRKILNSMDDALVTITSTGNIIHCNTSFYKMFQFNENDVFGQKLTIYQIIPSLEIKEFFDHFNTLDAVITPDKDLKAVNKVGKDFPVRVNLNFCHFYTNDISLGEVIDTHKLVQQEKACIILIHNLSDRLTVEKEKITQEIIDFKQMFDNPLMRLDFKEYCKRTRTDENICFLEDVQIYKNTSSLQERVQKQETIYNLYLKKDSKKLLNISKEELELNNFKISKGLGEVDLFECLEKIVMNNLIHDSYKRWKETEKSDLQLYL